MRGYPNLAAELSANSGANAMLRDPEYAASFLNEFRGRVMFGTDICTKSQRPPTAKFLMNLLDRGKISTETFDMIASENAIRLLML